MAFLLADTFHAGRDLLSSEEQKASNLAPCELQMNPANPGMWLHRVEISRNKNIWPALPAVYRLNLSPYH